MNKIIKHIFPFLNSTDFLEDKSYMVMFSATLFLLTSLFSFQIIKLYTPDLYLGVERAFPFAILFIFILLFITSFYFIVFIIIPFTVNLLFISLLIPKTYEHGYLDNYKIFTYRQRSLFVIPRFRSPISTVFIC